MQLWGSTPSRKNARVQTLLHIPLFSPKLMCFKSFRENNLRPLTELPARVQKEGICLVTLIFFVVVMKSDIIGYIYFLCICVKIRKFLEWGHGATRFRRFVRIILFFGARGVITCIYSEILNSILVLLCMFDIVKSVGWSGTQFVRVFSQALP